MTINFDEVITNLDSFISCFNKSTKTIEKLGYLELIINELECSAAAIKRLKEIQRKSLISKGIES